MSNGFTCPTCGANTCIGETSLDGWDDDLANGHVFVDVTCPACHTEYTNVYRFDHSVTTYEEES